MRKILAAGSIVAVVLLLLVAFNPVVNVQATRSTVLSNIKKSDNIIKMSELLIQLKKDIIITPWKSGAFIMLLLYLIDIIQGCLLTPFWGHISRFIFLLIIGLVVWFDQYWIPLFPQPHP